MATHRTSLAEGTNGKAKSRPYQDTPRDCLLTWGRSWKASLDLPTRPCTAERLSPIPTTGPLTNGRRPFAGSQPRQSGRVGAGSQGTTSPQDQHKKGSAQVSVARSPCEAVPQGRKSL